MIRQVLIRLIIPLLVAGILITILIYVNQASPKSTPQPTYIPAPTLTPTPSIELIINPSAPAGVGCFLTSHGVTCLDQTGWYHFPRTIKDLQEDTSADIAICADGSFIFPYAESLVLFDGKTTKTLEGTPGMLADHAACNSAADIWMSNASSISHYDGKKWQEFTEKELTTAVYSNEHEMKLVDVVLNTVGELFVIQTGTISLYDGTAWKSIKEGGSFLGAALDRQGQLWVSYPQGLLLYKGGAWQDYPYEGESTLLTKPAIDSSDRLWVGSLGSVLAFDPDSGWVKKKIESSEAFGRDILSLAFDAAGRLWIGTEYGLLVVEGKSSGVQCCLVSSPSPSENGLLASDGKNLHVYHMHTSDLSSNYIFSIAFSGDAGVPKKMVKPTGTLSGRILKSGAPQVGIPVEVCPSVKFLFYTTPCDGQPFYSKATTDVNGRFEISTLPAGYYELTFKADDQWTIWTGDFETGCCGDILVKPGKNTDVGELET
jgi:hypothetical protein